jgi:hypothetical protein
MQKSQPRFFEVGYRTLFVEVSVRFFLEVCVQFVVAGVKVHRDHGANGERKCEGREKDKFPHGSSPDFVRRHRRVAGHFDAGDKGSMKTISSESLTDILSNPIRIARFSIRTTLLSKTNHAPETGGQSRERRLFSTPQANPWYRRRSLPFARELGVTLPPIFSREST